MCMIDDCDPCSFFHSRLRKASKEHHCNECCRAIVPGEYYIRHSFSLGSRMYESLMCAHCEGAAKWLMKHCGGFVTEGVLEDLRHHYEEENYRPDQLGRIIVGMQRRWQNFSGGVLPIPIVQGRI